MTIDSKNNGYGYGIYTTFGIPTGTRRKDKLKPIIIRFQSASRNDTSYEFESEDADMIFGERRRYAAMGRMDKHIIKELRETLEALKVPMVEKHYDVIQRYMEKAVTTCEGRYGNNVLDYEKYECDSAVIIKFT